ncbi:deoxyribonuclease V [Dehalogenimonas formicexedens]|uniref:Endonuclease V n=1 Tax=Dehalogenimonas formicexedens TaxID=1839801 RepID=A0A1P8F784_9CHLR|nr:deoxyribonuclease V [Dehalogenimonas formicexedens]APV44212.1 deoxyribonuclease V [Dehalogenimonas formicexedens]
MISELHPFELSYSSAVKLQTDLASSIVCADTPVEVKLIAGIDVSVGRQGSTGRSAVVVMSYPSLEIVAESIHEGTATMPYIPGLLSFRELPLILPALEKLDVEPDLFMVDGQGIAHPRRLGIASHLGLIVGKPSIGCAKSRLCGEHQELGPDIGNGCALTDRKEIIGRVLRTRAGTKPIFVSVGHMISLETAVDWVLKLNIGYRLPEPVRQAHLAAGRKTAGVYGNHSRSKILER